MSFHHVAWTLKHSDTKGVPRLTLLVLAHHANDLDESYPSIPTVCAEANISRRGAQTALRSLEDDGWIVNCGAHSDPRYKGAIVYRLPDPEGGANAAPAQSATKNDVVDCAQKEVKKKEGSKEEEPSLTRSKEVRPTATQLEAEAVQRIWDHYQRIIPSKRRLDDKRKRIIRNALHLVGEEQVKLAILGLSRSPHHNGQNEQRRDYLDLRYALKGIGDESDDERIEKAIAWATIHDPDQGVVEEAKVQRWLEEIRYTLSLPHRPMRERAKDAYFKLGEAGFTVLKLDGPPWARITR